MKAKTKRMFWSMALPVLIFGGALFMSAVTTWLEKFFAGRMLMLAALLSLVIWSGVSAWRWEGWSDDASEDRA